MKTHLRAMTLAQIATLIPKVMSLNPLISKSEILSVQIAMTMNLRNFVILSPQMRMVMTTWHRMRRAEHRNVFKT